MNQDTGKYKFVNLTCKFQWKSVKSSHYIIPTFLTILIQQKQRRKKKRKGRRNGKDGRRREDDVTRNCLLYLYLKIVLSISIANLKSCILHCVTIGKKWSTVFKLYAKTCLYFFLFFWWPEYYRFTHSCSCCLQCRRILGIESLFIFVFL